TAGGGPVACRAHVGCPVGCEAWTSAGVAARIRHMENRESHGPTRRGFLSASAATAGAGAGPLPGGPASAAWGLAGPGQPATPQQPDRNLRDLLQQIDPARIEATVNRLVQFGTRHTLSSQDDPVRGIGAARDWIFAQLQQYAQASGGRMTVAKQSFVQ